MLRFLRKKSWAHQDSNLEQAGYEPAALTVELWARQEVWTKTCEVRSTKYEREVRSTKYERNSDRRTSNFALRTCASLRRPTLQERAQLPAAGRMSQLPQGLGFDLAD